MLVCLCFKDRRLPYERLYLHRDAGNGQARLVHKRTLPGERLERLGEVQACVWVNWGAEPPDTTLRVTQQTILKRDLMFLGNHFRGQDKGLQIHKKHGSGSGREGQPWKWLFPAKQVWTSDLKGSDINSQSPPGQSSALPPAYTLQILTSTKRLQRK